MKIQNFAIIAALALLLGSCATPKVAYLQDTATKQAMQVLNTTEIRVRPEDKIMILVSSKEPQLMSLFNLSISTRQIGNTSSNASSLTGGGSGNGGVVGYTVRKDGTIDFPVLGSVYVSGMTREEIAAHIKNELITQNLVKDPVVTVEFMNLTVTVLGEVAKPGRYSIDNARLSLLDALGMAGDLTVFAKRENVLVQREENGKKVLYRVDLTSGHDLYASPIYYLQQNDVVYVEPNAMKARQSTVNGNSVRTPGFWASLVSLALTLTTTTLLFVK